ncbi:MAG: mechanosensitive ion channel [Pelovirga sp.]
MDNVKTVLSWLGNILQWPLVETAETRITLWAILSFVALVLALLWFARRTQRWLAEGPLLRMRMSESARYSVGALVRYLILLIGLLVIVQTVGVDLTAFTVLAGAIGIGVGFGLQNIVSNFIAGLIIMFERPVKIGDRIVVGGVEGNVVNIGARSTTVLNNDNIAVIVPNSKFITDNVVNWKYNNNEVRFGIPVSVAYGSDARQVERILLEIADEESDVLSLPSPAVRFIEFGDNGLLFELRAWSSSLVDRKGKLISQLNFSIYERFNQEGIAFPFPQRDIHLRSGVLEIRKTTQTENLSDQAGSK